MSKIFKEIQSAVQMLEWAGDEEGNLLSFNADLLTLCNKALAKPDELDEDEEPAIREIKVRALTVLARILKVRSEREIRIIVARKAKLTDFRGTLSRDEISRRIDAGKGPTGLKTKMFAEWQARPYEVMICGGRFCRRKDSGRLVEFHTFGMESHGKLHYGAYVISLEGRIYVFNHLDKSDRVAHSSFVRGAPVLAAGEIRVTGGGRLMALTSYSGHYKPDKEAIFDTLSYFKTKCISLVGVVVMFTIDPKLSKKTSLRPLSPDRLPWIFLSDKLAFSTVKENVELETTDESERKRFLKQDLVTQGGLGSRYVYDANAFWRAVHTEHEQGSEDLLSRLEALKI